MFACPGFLCYRGLSNYALVFTTLLPPPLPHSTFPPHLASSFSSKPVRINKTKCITYTAPHLRLTLPVPRPQHVPTAVPYPRQSALLARPSALHGPHFPTNSRQTSINPGLIPGHRCHAPQLQLLALPPAVSHLEARSRTPSPSHSFKHRRVPSHSPASPAAGTHPQFSLLNVSSRYCKYSPARNKSLKSWRASMSVSACRWDIGPGGSGL